MYATKQLTFFSFNLLVTVPCGCEKVKVIALCVLLQDEQLVATSGAWESGSVQEFFDAHENISSSGESSEVDTSYLTQFTLESCA